MVSDGGEPTVPGSGGGNDAASLLYGNAFGGGELSSIGGGRRESFGAGARGGDSPVGAVNSRVNAVL